MSRRSRLISASAMCSSATALWIVSASAGTGGHITPTLVAVGVLIPFGSGALTLWLTEGRIATDLQPVEPVEPEAQAVREQAKAGVQ